MPLFKRRQQEVKPDIHEAVEKINASVSSMSKKADYLQEEIAKERERVKMYMGQRNRTLALSALKRQKMLEKQLQTVQASRFKLEQQVGIVEGIEFNKDMFETMKTAHAAMTTVTADIDPDAVADLMDDMEDQMAEMDEINEALAQPFGDFADIDADLDAELDEMEKESLDAHFLGATGVPATPVPAPETAKPAAEAPVPAGPSEQEAYDALASQFQ